MTIDEDLRAKIRRLHYAEHWPVGTIAAQLDVHHDTVRREDAPASVSLGAAGAAFGAAPNRERSTPEEAASAVKLWVPFRPIVTRKESPQVAEIAKEIGLLPRAGSGKTTPAEHALGEKLSDSPNTSVSERRGGAPGFEGEPVRIDIKEAVRTGSEYISHRELQEQVAEHGKAHPEKAPRIEKVARSADRASW